MSVPYEMIEETVVVPNMADPLFPADSLGYEIRTTLADPVPKHKQDRVLGSNSVGEILRKQNIDGGASGESYVTCLSTKNYVSFIGSLFRVVPDEHTFANVLAMVLLSGSGGFIFCPYSGHPHSDGSQYLPLGELAKHTALRMLDIVPWNANDGLMYSSLLDRGEM